VSYQVTAAQAGLIGAAVSFRTGDEGKDAETDVLVSITNVHGRLCADLDSPLRGFPGQFQSEPFPLDVSVQVPAWTMNGSTLRMGVRGSGSAKWQFGVTLSLLFDDQSTWVIAEEDLELCQDSGDECRALPVYLPIDPPLQNLPNDETPLVCLLGPRRADWTHEAQARPADPLRYVLSSQKWLRQDDPLRAHDVTLWTYQLRVAAAS
jgi:hypothetical protein